ncbi:MAG TPA: PPOX class F420-dependent oxidoreductase [Actinomycetospora sp.]|nr:PPOX class F420-dependent oxidoreductase [Actinomycetospora sp.]
MPKPPLPDDVQDLLRKPNPSVVVSVRGDGQPVSVPTWYLWEDGRVLVNMDAQRKRVEYLRNDPRVSISVLSEDDWYTHVSMQGRVVEWADDTDLADIDRCAKHYTGKPYPIRDRERVTAWIEVDRWHGWGAVKASDVPDNAG